MPAVMPGDRIVIGNSVDELRRMTQWLHAGAAAMDIPQHLVFPLDLCANEAVHNIIRYAYADAGRHDITLQLSGGARGALLVICDDGMPFNPLAVPDHEVAPDIEHAKIGGLGIRLMRAMMARCDYRRVDGCNVLTLETRRVP